MKKIRINAKAAPTIDQILAKVNSGFENIEIQLLHEFVSKDEYHDIKTAIDKYGIDISVVHTPLISVEGEVLLEEVSLIHLLKEKYFNIFNDTCKYSQYIADIEKHRIKVVIHNTWSKEDWKITNLIEEKIAPKIKQVLDKYKDIDLVVENSTSIGEKTFKSILCMEDVSYSVIELQKTVGNRVNTLIDTCHMMMNWEAWRRITNNNLTNWEKAFYQSTVHVKLGLVHLNNVRDIGIKNEDHGIAFDKNINDDMRRLKEIMNVYAKYAECEITIEVREDDYKGVPKNLIKTSEALRQLGYELDLGK